MTAASEKKRSTWRQDLGLVLGALSVAYGFWLAWHPLGYMIGGVLLAGGCFLSGYRREGAR